MLAYLYSTTNPLAYQSVRIARHPTRSVPILLSCESSGSAGRAPYTTMPLVNPLTPLPLISCTQNFLTTSDVTVALANRATV